MIQSGRKFWSFTILAGAALAALLAAGLLRRPATTPAPALPAAVREAVAHEALEWRSTASLVVAAASTQLAWLDSEDAVQDEARLIEVCDNLASASGALVEDCRRRAASAARMVMGVEQVEVERFFRQTLREVLPRFPEGEAGQDDVFFQLQAVPLHSFIFFAPALAPPNPVLQRILERLLQVLTRLLQLLPPGSPAATAVQRAIDAILALLGTTDTVPIIITFTAPAEGSIVKVIPTITFEMKDDNSGPNPETRQLIASSTAPVNQTVDLTPFTQVAFDDTAGKRAVIATRDVPAGSIQDGFLTLLASGTDFAGNPRATSSLRIVLDTQAPGISVTSPQAGSTLSSTSVSFAALISDATSGIRTTSIVVQLNGTDVSSGISLTPTTPNSLGFPMGTLLAGALTASLGSNRLLITADDVAGNSSTSEVMFTVAGGANSEAILAELALVSQTIVERQYAIDIVSGNGQQGLTGRAAAEPLKVRVYDPTTGVGLRNVGVDFSVTGGPGGFITTDSSLANHTDASGLAAATYVLGLSPGVNMVTASITGREEINRVFTLQGLSPSFTDVSNPSVCNVLDSTSEYQGSALPKLIKVQVKDHQSRPLKGEVVNVDAYDGQTGTANPSIGTFLPRRSVTDEDGTALFAFVISRIAPVGPFTMRFTLPRFLDEDGESLLVSVGGEVKDPATKPRNSGDVEINYDDALRSGQAQIGLPGRRLSLPLRGRIFGGPGGLIYSILEGDGLFEQGIEGTVGLNTIDECGRHKMGIRTIGDGSGNGIGDVFFTLKAGHTHALIAIEGFTDIFAVGPPEIRFVSKADPTQEIVFGQPIAQASVEASKGFLLECWVPSGYPNPIQASLRSLDPAERDLSEPQGIAPVSRSFTLDPVQHFVDGRYAIFRSSDAQAFGLTTFVQQAGLVAPSLGNLAGIQAVTDGLLWPRVTLPGQQAEQEGPKLGVLEVFTEKLIYPRDKAFQIRVATKIDGPEYTWRIEGVDGSPTATPDWRKPSLWVKYVQNAPTPAAGDGKSATQPYQISLPRLNQDGIIRRPTFVVKPSWKPLNGGAAQQLDKIIFLVHTDRTQLAAEDLPATDADLSAKFPFYSDPNNFTPFVGPVPGIFAKETGSQGLRNAIRLVYSPVDAGRTYASTHGGFLYNVLADDPTEYIAERPAIGTAVRPFARTRLDLVDLTAVVTGHEERHVRNMLSANLDQTHVLRLITLEVMKLYFDDNVVPAAVRADPAAARAVRSRLLSAANRVAIAFDEVQVSFAELKETLVDKKTSWFLQDGSLDTFTVRWEDMLNILIEGVAAKEAEGNPPVLDISVRGAARTRIVELMQGMYKELGAVKVASGDTTFEKDVANQFPKGPLERLMGGDVSVAPGAGAARRQTAKWPRVLNPVPN